MKLKNFVLVGSMAVLGVAFTSCSKGEELFDSGAKVAQQKSEYATNFEKKYGPIDPNQTWDFATMEPISYLPSTSPAGTRGTETSGEVTLKSSGKMSIGNSVVAWMHENMEAGKNNSQKGSPFISETDQRTFTIVPFYQGCASYYWELWMNVGGNELKIWTKNKDLTYKDDHGNWLSPTNKDGIPLSAEEIDAPTYTFEATPGQTMYFFLKVWTGGDAAYTRGDAPSRISSLDRMMLALEGVQGLTGVPEGSTATVIGCEDNSKSASDKDFEDLVFIMYGPEVQHFEEKEVRETKRYMMEDLGTTDDFDFNDVVVDVANVYKKKLEYGTNNQLLRETEIPNSRHQEAIVRAAGGTMNFTIEIGTNTITRWTKSPTYVATDMLNTGWGNKSIHYSGDNSILAKFDIENNDWNPATNNIRVLVDGNGASGEVMVIEFPKKGAAPMMIAVPETQNWMTERSSVPSSWWYKVD
jgi:hypothetical protein